MKVVSAILALAVLAPAQATNPIAKVLSLLSNLETKIVAEGAAAQKDFNEFTEWCEDRSRNVGFEIQTATAEVADLNAVIDKETASSGALAAKIDSLAGDIATDEADLKAATEIRDHETADFTANQNELTEVVDTLHRAVAILSKEMQGGASMMQLKNAGSVTQALKIMVEAAALTSADASRLTALVQSSQEADSDDADAGAPDAAVYESHSGDIVGVLQGLLDKAEEQLANARKTETNERQNFQLLRQSIEDEIRFGKSDKADAEKALAASAESKAAAQGNLGMTSKALAADQKDKADLHQTCQSRSEDFEAATKSRAAELKALADAKRVIKENTGGAEDISYSFLQTRYGTHISTGNDLAHFEAVRFVRDLSRKMNSPLLAQLASRMASAIRSGASDPFAKVKGLISDLLARLEDEASSDATEKSYCDKEISESNEKKDKKNAEIAKLSTSIDQMSSKSSQLKGQVAALQSALANLAGSQAEANKMRAEENANFKSNKADMEQGLEGVKSALSILRDYYAQDGKAHGAAEGAGAGIISLLEVCESDFSQNLAEMNASEGSAQNSYDRITKENEVEKTMKDQDVKYKNKESVRLDKHTAEASSDRSGVQAELDAILDYLAKLHKRCDEVAETYGDRTARRESELAGLKQALEILESESALVQTSTRHIHAHVA